MIFFPAPSEMPPLVSHKLKHACDNFPLCKGRQKRAKNNGQSLPRLSFCATCAESTCVCSHPDCISPAAPAFKKDKRPLFCSTHYSDPAYVSTRCWNLCKNSSHVAVCPQKWLTDLVMLVAAMNILASSRPSVVPCMCAARIRRPRSGGTLV